MQVVDTCASGCCGSATPLSRDHTYLTTIRVVGSVVARHVECITQSMVPGEPTYVYKKGEGWVVVYGISYNDYVALGSSWGVLCGSCGARAGSHYSFNDREPMKCEYVRDSKKVFVF